MKGVVLSCLVFMLLLTASPAKAEKLCTIKKGWPIAATAELLEKAVAFGTSGDMEALGKLTDAGLAGVTKDRFDVYLGTGGGFTKARVRRPGSTSYFWALPESLECP